MKLKIFLYKIYFWFLKLFAKKKQVKDIQAELLAEMISDKVKFVKKIQFQKPKIASCRKVWRLC